MKKVIFLSVFFLWQSALGLPAPYLYSADTVADTAVQLTWRNNSIDYQGIIILRKTVAAGAYSVIDTALGSATSFVDIVKPPSQVTYYYALTAYSLTEHADTSNMDSATITPKKSMGIFINPQNLVVSYDTLTHTVHVQFYDSSTVETGYKVYKSTNFAAFEIIKDIVSATPSQKGPLYYTDSTILLNTWYQYYVVAYSGQQNLNSDTAELFTFDLGTTFQNISRKCTISNKVSSFPIRYKGWSLKSGDTIALNEIGSPDSLFSIINVSNPSVPNFAGVGKSPSAMDPNPYTRGPYLFWSSCYKYYLGKITVESLIISDGYVIFFPGFLSDTTFIIVKESSSKFSKTDEAMQYSFKNGSVSPISGTYIFTIWPGDYFEYIDGMIYNGKFFFNFQHTTDSGLEIIDYNYFPKVKTSIQRIPPIKFPSIVDGISINVPYAHNIFIDSVKNLVFAVFDSVLTIYNCQITTGTTKDLSNKPRSVQSLRIGREYDQCVIFLPHHLQPADVSVYNVSGRLEHSFNSLSGETIKLNRENKTGVYLIKAVIDGQTYLSKIITIK